MASGALLSAKCGLCSEVYDDPRMLPCLHSFCSKCLEKELEKHHLKNSLKCPQATCGRSASLPDEDVCSLPKDLRKIYEAEVTHYLSKIHSKEEISCDHCIDTSNGSAVSFCIECCKFLCSDCVKHHMRGRDTHNHELQPLGSEMLESKKVAKFLENIPHKSIYCHLHKGETHTYFCETCCLLICRDCVMCEHRDHTYNYADNVAKKEKADLISRLGSTKSATSELDKAIAKGDRIVQQLKAKQKSVEEDIESAFKTLQEALQTRKKVLLAKASEISLGKQTALTIQGERFKKLRDEIVEISEMITSATQVYTSAEMLSVKGAIANKLKQLLELYQDTNLEACKSAIMPNILDTSDLAVKIASFGVVLGGSYPAQAKTDLHIARAVVGKERKVTILAHDVKGKPFSLGGEMVEVKLTLMGSKNPPINGAVVDNKCGTYVATFTPSACGEHELSITIERQEIKGSPFVLHVRQDRNYANLASSGCQRVFSTSSHVMDVAVDDNGDVYVVVSGNHCIEVFNKEGTKLPNIGTCGTSSSRDGQFNNPNGIAIRGSVLYVADSGNNRIQKLTTSGKFISKFGTNDSGAGQLSSPRGICLDIDGRVFVSEKKGNRVSVFVPDGKFAYHITDNLSSPWGLAFDPMGSLHVANYGTNDVAIFSPDGKYIDTYRSPFNYPAGIAINAEGYIFLGEHYTSNASYNYSRIAVLDPEHKRIGYVQNFTHVPAVALDKEGFVYICSQSHCQVHKY